MESESIRIGQDTVTPPKGWRIAGWHKPTRGEWYLTRDGKICKAETDLQYGEFFIFEPIPPARECGEGCARFSPRQPPLEGGYCCFPINPRPPWFSSGPDSRSVCIGEFPNCPAWTPKEGKP